MLVIAIVAQGHKHASLNAIGCGFDSRNFPFEEIIYIFFALVTWQSEAYISTTQYTMPPEFGREVRSGSDLMGTEYCNTKFHGSLPCYVLSVYIYIVRKTALLP